MKPNKIKKEFEEKFWENHGRNHNALVEILWQFIEKSLDQQREEIKEKIEKMKKVLMWKGDGDREELTRGSKIQGYNEAIDDILKEL